MLDGAGQFVGFQGSASAVLDESSPRLEPAPESDGGAFAERLDHALRGPLDKIITDAQTIGEQSEGPLRRDYAGYSRDIASAGRHLLELVNDLVDLQSIERPGFNPAPEDIDLADVARRAAGLLAVRAAADKVRIEGPNDTDRIPARGEFRRVLQIVMNLVTNAVRYSPEGGVVTIAVEAGRNEARLSVTDQGPGIAQADQQRIFEKFERLDSSDPGGTGLGLYIARRLARAMGGELTVKSVPGKGARFTVSLPT
jgi:signal transduction histidine kinase